MLRELALFAVENITINGKTTVGCAWKSSAARCPAVLRRGVLELVVGALMPRTALNWSASFTVGHSDYYEMLSESGSVKGTTMKVSRSDERLHARSLHSCTVSVKRVL